MCNNYSQILQDNCSWISCPHLGDFLHSNSIYVSIRVSLFVHTADPPSPSNQGQRDPHTSPPLLSMVSSGAASWPQYGPLEITQTVRLKSRSNWSLLQFMKRPGCGENCIQKFSCYSVRKGACCTGLPAGLPIKENPGEPSP